MTLRIKKLLTAIDCTALIRASGLSIAVMVSTGATANPDIIIRSADSVSSSFASEYRSMGGVDADSHDHEAASMSDMDSELEFYRGGDVITSKINELSGMTTAETDSIGYLSKRLETPKSVSPSRHILALLPVKNAVTSSAYGYRNIPNGSRMHKGIDLAAPTGTPIHATGEGVVTYSGWVNGYGKYIKIKHADGYETRYAHCSELLVSKGDTVRQNQVIAKVGTTGRSSGPHLHYEVRKNGEPTNPQVYLAMAEE